MPRLSDLVFIVSVLPLLAAGPGLAQADPCAAFEPVPGWPLNTSGAVSSVDVVELLAEEPGAEVVLVEGERVNVYGGGGRLLDVFFLPGIFSRVPSFADLDGDGTTDLVLGSEDGLYRWSPTAQPRLTRLTDTPPSLRPVTLADLDADGLPEMIELENGSGRLHVRDGSGNPLPGWPLDPFAEPGPPSGPSPRVVTGPPVVADLDRDGRPEIVVLGKSERTAEAPTVAAYAPDGTRLWSHRLLDDYVFYVGNSEDVLWFDDLVAGDVDDDGRLEVVVLHDGSNLRTVGGVHTWLVLDHRGRVEQRWTLPRVDVRLGGARTQLALSDLDGDGDLEILHGGEQPTAARGGLVFAWHHDGRLVDGFPVVAPADPVGAVLAVDVTGDPAGADRPELLAAPARTDLTGARLPAWDSAGRTLDCFPLPLPRLRGTNALLSKPLPRPAVGDLDGDGDLDVLVRIGSGEIHARRLVGSARSGPGTWPTFRGTLARTGAAPSPPEGLSARPPVEPVSCGAAPGLCL